MQDTKKIIMQANDLLGQERFDEALALLDTLEQDQTGLVSFVRGNIYLQMGLDERAHLCYSEALNQGFAHKKLYINFGVVKSRMGKITQAEQMFRQAADLDLTDSEALNRLLLLRMGTDNWEGAEAVMEELMTRHPELMDGYHHKADLLLGTGRAQQALELLQSVAQRFSTNALYIYDLCRALGRVGRTQDALSCLQSHAELFADPLSQELFKKQKAVLLLDLGQIQEAMPLWQELYDQLGDRQAGLALVTHGLYTGDWETACQVADEMLSYDVEDEAHYMCLFHKAMARKYQGDEQVAREAFQAAAAQYDLLEGEKLLPKFRTLRVNIRMELGRYDDARKDLQYLKKLLEKQDPEKIRKTMEQLTAMENIIDQKQNAFN